MCVCVHTKLKSGFIISFEFSICCRLKRLLNRFTPATVYSRFIGGVSVYHLARECKDNSAFGNECLLFFYCLFLFLSVLGGISAKQKTCEISGFSFSRNSAYCIFCVFVLVPCFRTSMVSGVK